MGVLRHMLAYLLTTTLAAVAVLGPCCGQDQGTGPIGTVPVFGLVRDSLGKPVEGATVREVRRVLGGVGERTAVQMGLGTRYGASATTNSRGKFVLKVTAGGTFGIVAMRGNSERSIVIAPAAPAGQHTLDLKQVVRVKGRFTDIEGRGDKQRERPPQRRLVRSMGPVLTAIPGRNPLTTFGIIEEVTTDAQGRFELATLKNQTCRLTDQWNQCEAHVTEKHEGDFVLLRHVRKVGSRVVHNATGEPITTARIHINGQSRSVSKNGAFEVYLPDNYSLPITATGFQSTWGSSNYNISSIGMREAAKVQLVATHGDGTPARELELFAGYGTRLGSGKQTLARYMTDAFGQVMLTRWSTTDRWVWAKIKGRFVRLAQIPGGIGDMQVSVSTTTYAVHGTVLGIDGLPAMHIPVFTGPDLQLGGQWPTIGVPAAFTDHAGKFTIPALSNDRVCIAATVLGKLQALAANVKPNSMKHLQLQLREVR